MDYNGAATWGMTLWNKMTDDVRASNTTTVYGLKAFMDSTSGATLAAQVTKAFADGEVPDVATFRQAGCVVWSRPNGPPLLEGPLGGLCFERANFLLYGAPSSFWPPPIRGDLRNASAAWDFTAAMWSDQMTGKLFGEKALIGTCGAVFRAGMPVSSPLLFLDKC